MRLTPRLKSTLGWNEWQAALGSGPRDPMSAFETAFAQKFHNAHGVMFPHGRTGLYALLQSWNLQNTEVICPAYTCVVVPHAVVFSGNIPVFVDCAERSVNMGLEQLAQAITEKTRVVIATHLFGYPMDAESVQNIVEAAEKRHGHKIYVIQDCAHSFGAKWQDRLVSEWGDASIFGLNISKMITSVFGGMVTTNSDTVAEGLRKWRETNLIPQGVGKELRRLAYFAAVNVAFNRTVYGSVNWLERQGWLDRFVKYYDEGVIDFPKDWNEAPAKIEARIGLAQLETYDSIVQAKMDNAKAWREKLRDDAVSFFPDMPGATYSHCVGLVEDREAWVERFHHMGVQLGILIEYAIPYMKAYAKYRRGDYPVSEYYSRHMVNFPNWPGVNISVEKG